MRKPGLAIAASLVLLVSGCSWPFSRAAEEPEPACAGEPTSPLTAAEVTEMLHKHSINVYPDPTRAICDPRADDEDMPVSLTNIPSRNLDSQQPVTAREGHVFCGLRRSPVWGWKLRQDLDAPPASPIFSGDKARFFFANLECTIYPEGARSRAQVARLARAVKELARIAARKRD